MEEMEDGAFRLFAICTVRRVSDERDAVQQSIS